MVSKSSSTRRVGQRAVSGVENYPFVPVTKSSKTLSAKCRQRRLRTSPKTLVVVPKQYLVQQSQRKNDLTAPKPKSTLALSMSDSNANARAPSSSSTKRPMLRLPKELSRPQNPREVSLAALAALDPSLDGTPPQYVRDQLEDVGPSLWLGMAGNKVFPSSQPPFVDVVAPNAGAYPPTHVLGLYKLTGHPSANMRTAIPVHSLMPIHAVILAAHCANLPSFPVATTPSASHTPTDPISHCAQPIGLPSPETFPILVDYLYNKRSEKLLNQVLPSPAPPTLEYDQLAQIPLFGAQLGRDFSPIKIIEHMQSVHNIWLNAKALEVVDDGLWDTIELAWDVLMAAMAQSAGRPELNTLPVPSL